MGIFMKSIIKFTLAVFTAVAFFGCSGKDDELYNLTPQQWFEVILYNIQDEDMESAHLHYTAFASEHISAPLLENTLLILADASAQRGDYTKANEYLDDYMKRFGTREKIEYARFLKIKAYFNSFSKPNRNQKLLNDCQLHVKLFLEHFPNSKYRPIVETMLAKFKMGEFYLQNNIYKLYKRTGKDASAAVYKEKIDSSPFKNLNMTEPKTPWYSKPFE